MEPNPVFTMFSDMESMFLGELVQDLIWTLDLSTCNGIVVDGALPYLLDDKTLCYPTLTDEELNMNKMVTNFAPFSNKKLAQKLFERYIHIINMEDPDLRVYGFNIYVVPYTNAQMSAYNAVCNTSRGVYTSHTFTNESVAWLELINIMDDKLTPDMPYKYYYIDTCLNTNKNINRFSKKGGK